MATVPVAPPIQIPGRSSVRNALGSPIASNECNKLSALNCGKNPSCKFNNLKQICEPFHSAGNSNMSYQTYEEYFFEGKKKWREGVARWISDKHCDIGATLRNVKVLTTAEKGSASDSIIISGLINESAMDKVFNVGNSNIIIKTTFKPIDDLDNSLQVELAIYKNIISELVNNHHTPNILSYLGSFDCRDNTIDLPEKQIDKFIDIIQSEHIQRKYDTSEINLLFLERSAGITLHEWLEHDRTEEEYLSIIFQMVYTLMCFGNIGLLHNDLHFGNIFVEDMGKPITLFFAKNGGEYIELTTRWIPKIFDWDRGSMLYPSVPRNLTLDAKYCTHYGTCNFYNPKYDMYTFIFNFCYNPQYGFDFQDSLLIKWIDKYRLIDPVWIKKVARGKTPHLLKEFPGDHEMASPRNFFHSLINSDWNKAPWKVRKGDASLLLPENIFFIPPQEKHLYFSMSKAISRKSHQNWIVQDDGTEFKNTSQYNIMSHLITIWTNDFEKRNPNYLVKTSALFMKEIRNKNPNIRFGTEISNCYNYAVIMLIIPAYNSLNEEAQLAVTGPYIAKIIDNIWNMFGNILPVDILNINLV